MSGIVVVIPAQYVEGWFHPVPNWVVSGKASSTHTKKVPNYSVTYSSGD